MSSHPLSLSTFQFPLAHFKLPVTSRMLSRPPSIPHIVVVILRRLKLLSEALMLIYIQWQTHKVTEHAEHEINWIRRLDGNVAHTHRFN